MDFEEFREKTKKEMERRLGAGKVEIREIIKNNSIKRTGMVLSKPGEEASPVIYLDAWQEKTCGVRGFKEAMEEIWALYLRNAGKEPFDRAEFMDWERAKGKISVRLIHYRENEERLKDMPHERFLDLAAVYYYTAEKGEEGAAAVQIQNVHMEAWGICRRELKETAHENHKKDGGTRIRGMDEVIGGLLGGPIDSGCSPMQMYVATNRRKTGGAAAMLFAEELSGLAEKLGSDLYILPSSIHEILLLPADMGSPEELAEIVKEVNRTQVAPEEKLSDNVYRFCRECGEVKIA